MLPMATGSHHNGGPITLPSKVNIVVADPSSG